MRPEAQRARPLFLARRAYRLRRLTDAARLLPLAGLLLFLLPLFWRDPAAGQAATAPGALFLFLAWVALILATAVLARFLRRAEAANDPPDNDPPAGDNG